MGLCNGCTSHYVVKEPLSTLEISVKYDSNNKLIN